MSQELPSVESAKDYSSQYGRFRALLRKIREEAGLSQTALAEKLKKPQTFVSKSELGERRIDFIETIDFCAACEVSINEFIARFKKIAEAEDLGEGRSAVVPEKWTQMAR